MRQIDFEHGGIAQNILKAALPMLVAQVLTLLYNIVDRIYIARIPDIGTAALGALGLCFPIIVIITAFSNLFGSGGAPLFAIARGSGDKARAGLILNLACTLLLCCAGVLMVIGLLFARPILVLFGASPEALQYALPYLMLYLLGTYPSMLTTGLNPFINAQGYATAGMLSVVIGAAANLVLDPVFIFVLGMGICGAAAALASAARQQALHRRYRQPWHSGLHHAADQQRGDDLLQQCAVRDRRRYVHLGHDDHFQRAPDGGNADLCHYRGLFPPLSATITAHAAPARCCAPPSPWP